jgi:general stress protein YciG
MDAVKQVLAGWGRKGGRARAKTLSPERRREIARMGGRAKHAQGPGR